MIVLFNQFVRKLGYSDSRIAIPWSRTPQVDATIRETATWIKSRCQLKVPGWCRLCLRWPGSHGQLANVEPLRFVVKIQRFGHRDEVLQMAELHDSCF